MRSVEIHVVETVEDLDHGLQAGLLELDELDGSLCSSCDEAVGSNAGTFSPFAIVLDDTDESWFVCLSCADGVLLDNTVEYEVDATLDEDSWEDDLEDDYEFIESITYNEPRDEDI